MKTCLHCGNEIPETNKFCNKSCATTYNNLNRAKKPRSKCAHCGKEVPLRNKFCSKRCGWDHKKKNRSAEYYRAYNCEKYKRYIARKKYQTPIGEDLDAIRKFYLACPEGYEVDHIIPLSKKGEHKLSNLQYLLAAENRRKSNKLDWK